MIPSPFLAPPIKITLLLTSFPRDAATLIDPVLPLGRTFLPLRFKAKLCKHPRTWVPQGSESTLAIVYRAARLLCTDSLQLKFKQPEEYEIRFVGILWIVEQDSMLTCTIIKSNKIGLTETHRSTSTDILVTHKPATTEKKDWRCFQFPLLRFLSACRHEDKVKAVCVCVLCRKETDSPRPQYRMIL